MFRDLYQSELEVLHRLSDELGSRFPELAPILGRDADPATARLFQRLAFAFAHVRAHLDDDVPEIIHAVFEELDPQLLEPVPSATLIELTPHPKTHRSATTVKAGVTFATERISGRPLSFVSTEACEVRPWVLRDAEASERRLRLVLTLLPNTRVARAIGDDVIALALTTERVEDALDLRAFLLNHTERVVARSGAAEVILGEQVRGLYGERPAFSTVRTYFATPLALCEMAIPGARKLVALGEAAREIEIILQLDAPPPRHVAIDASTLRLHCVQAISRAAIDTRLEPTATGRHSLKPSDDDHRILDVEHVEIIEGGSSRRLARWTPGAVTRTLDDDGGPVLFEVHRRAGIIDGDVDVAVSFRDENGPVSLPRGAHARARILVTSARRASELAVGAVHRATERSPTAMTFRNVAPVTRSGPAVFANDRLWEIFQFTKLGMPQIAERDTLARLLALLNVPAWAKWPRAKPNAERFEALRSVERRHATFVADGEAWPGLEIAVDVNPNAFLCDGDAYLFGEIVRDLLASALEQHEWITLTLRRDNLPSFHYPRRFGARV